jgi:FkbM family methyltransferase
MINVFIINLDDEKDRFESLSGTFRDSQIFRARRSSGIAGSCVPRVAADVLTRAPDYYKIGLGVLGVFLAHVSAWERVAASDAELSLVLEDDAHVINLDRFVESEIPPAADLVFCNDRMALPEKADSSGKGGIAYRPVVDALQRLAAVNSNSVGGDGYFLSRAGAGRLLEAIRRDWFFGHVDWRLLRYCVTERMVDDTIDGTPTAEILRRHHNRQQPPQWGILNAYASQPALVEHKWGALRRSREDRLGSSPFAHARPESPENHSVKRVKGEICSFSVRNTDFSFFVLDRQDVIQACHHNGRFYEPEELNIISENFPAGGTFVDVGANVGNHTVYVAKFLKAARIIAFEPNPAVQQMLLANIFLNNLQSLVDVSHLGIGLGDKSTRAHVKPRYQHNIGATQLQSTSASSDVGTVAVERGDDLLKCETIDMIKIDVEGMELDVLNGLQRTVSEQRPMIFIEVDRANEDFFQTWVRTNGYVIHRQFARYEGQINYLLIAAPT